MWRHDLGKFEYRPIASHLYIYVFYLRQITVLVFVHRSQQREWVAATAHRLPQSWPQDRTRQVQIRFFSSSIVISGHITWSEFLFHLFLLTKASVPHWSKSRDHVPSHSPFPTSPVPPVSLSSLHYWTQLPPFFSPLHKLKKNKVRKHLSS